jgi:o-succinylbenzoate synthase
MGNVAFMQEQIAEKLAQGFSCIKMKIGAINFNDEIKILASIRKKFTPEQIEIRVDANGAFSVNEALNKLNILSQYQLHSIEQPIAVKQPDALANICEKSPIPIALDEELIGVFNDNDKRQLLETIKPQYIILKPSLIGGFKGAQSWIDLAEQLQIGWWVTSALESNIGLNAIAQWTYTLNNPNPQGLGTGGLYINNIPSPLEVKNGALYYNSTENWLYNELVSTY